MKIYGRCKYCPLFMTHSRGTRQIPPGLGGEKRGTTGKGDTTMGDKGKKDKDKGQKQRTNKQDQKAKNKLAKQPKRKP